MLFNIYVVLIYHIKYINYDIMASDVILLFFFPKILFISKMFYYIFYYKNKDLYLIPNDFPFILFHPFNTKNCDFIRIVKFYCSYYTMN